MGILLQFNTALQHTFDELQQATSLEPEILQSNLDVFLKARVLYLTNNNYELNTDLKLKKLRINLNTAKSTEQKRDTEDTHKTVEDDRKFVTQAAIVRVMKSRKTMTHNTLIQEVILQLQSGFKPNIQTIKKAIEVMIEKEVSFHFENYQFIFFLVY